MKALRKSRTFLGLLLCCLLLLTGCRPAEEGTDPAQPEDTPLLTILVDELPQNLNPLETDSSESAVLINYLCDGLLEFNVETGRPAPCLAQSWDVSEDGLTLTLYLETGATFADGAAVNAQAVVQNIQRWQNQGSDELQRQLSSISSVRASGTSQVVLTLSRPDAGLFTVFCSPQTKLVSPNVLNAGTASENPQGAGSYQLEQIRNGTILLTQREDYFKGTPPHEQVEFRSVAPATAQIWMNESQDYLVIGGLVSQTTVAGEYQRYTTAGLSSYQLYLNLQQIPLITVRQLIGQTVQTNVTMPNGFLDQGGLLPDAVFEGEDVVFSANTDASLAQYSYGNMTLICRQDSISMELAQQIQQALNAQNCNLEIQALEEEAFRQAIARGDYDLCLVGQDILDCTDWLEMFTSPDTDPVHLQSDSLIKQAQGLMNMSYTKERTDALELFCSDLAQQAVVIPICQNSISVLSSQKYYLDPWGCFYA